MNPKISIQKLSDYCCAILIALIFISKISFKSIKLIPYSLPPFIFQHGLHPYINFGLQFGISLVLIFIWAKKKNKRLHSSLYINTLLVLWPSSRFKQCFKFPSLISINQYSFNSQVLEWPLCLSLSMESLFPHF